MNYQSLKSIMKIIIGVTVLVGILVDSSKSFNLGALAASLVTHGLQPQSKLSVGHGDYLRDDFRRNQLIPTFGRIRESLMDFKGSNWWIIFTLTSFVFLTLCGFFFMGMSLHNIKERVNRLELQNRG